MYVAATKIGRVNNLQRMIGSWHTLFREQTILSYTGHAQIMLMPVNTHLSALEFVLFIRQYGAATVVTS